MNYNNSSQPRNRWRVILFIIGCLLVVCGIVYMKKSSTGQKLLSTPLQADTTSRRIAIPDTTVAPDLLPPTADSLDFSVLPDTLLGKDKRNPYEAGYEDGYGAGCDDGAVGTHRASYDETSNFHTQVEKQNYTKGYREGYAKGYDDGSNGKQFNI